MHEIPRPLKELEAAIQYRFRNPALLRQALTHPSYIHNGDEADSGHNQRLEFLGDAVLGMIIAEALFENLPEDREGTLTRYRAILVRGSHLASIAGQISLGDFLLLGKSEESQGGRNRQSILEDAFEGIVGALYLDGGYPEARRVVLGIFGSLEKRIEAALETMNPKGRLQELLQESIPIEDIAYQIVNESGPDHRRCFTIEVRVQGKPMGTGKGSSKKEAEENAAQEALTILHSRSPLSDSGK